MIFLWWKLVIFLSLYFVCSHSQTWIENFVACQSETVSQNNRNPCNEPPFTLRRKMRQILPKKVAWDRSLVKTLSKKISNVCLKSGKKTLAVLMDRHLVNYNKIIYWYTWTMILISVVLVIVSSHFLYLKMNQMIMWNPLKLDKGMRRISFSGLVWLGFCI